MAPKRNGCEPLSIGSNVSCFRQVFLRVHSFIGIGAGLYIAFMSLTGCALVFYPELYRLLTPHPHIEARSASLNRAELTRAASKANPGDQVTWIWERPGLPVEIWMVGKQGQIEHLFDPFTGRDFGDAIPRPVRILNWVKDLHPGLLFGRAAACKRGRCDSPGRFSFDGCRDLVARYHPVATPPRHSPPSL